MGCFRPVMFSMNKSGFKNARMRCEPLNIAIAIAVTWRFIPFLAKKWISTRGNKAYVHCLTIMHLTSSKISCELFLPTWSNKSQSYTNVTIDRIKCYWRRSWQLLSLSANKSWNVRQVRRILRVKLRRCIICEQSTFGCFLWMLEVTDWWNRHGLQVKDEHVVANWSAENAYGLFLCSFYCCGELGDILTSDCDFLIS